MLKLPKSLNDDPILSENDLNLFILSENSRSTTGGVTTDTDPEKPNP